MTKKKGNMEEGRRVGGGGLEQQPPIWGEAHQFLT